MMEAIEVCKMGGKVAARWNVGQNIVDDKMHARQIDDGQAFRHRGSLVGGGVGGRWVDMD